MLTKFPSRIDAAVLSSNALVTKFFAQHKLVACHSPFYVRLWCKAPACSGDGRLNVALLRR